MIFMKTSIALNALLFLALTVAGQTVSFLKSFTNIEGEIKSIDAVQGPNEVFFVSVNTFDSANLVETTTLLKLNNQGDILEQHSFNNGNITYPTNIYLNDDGTLLVTGGFLNPGDCYSVVKLDQNFNVIWTRGYHMDWPRGAKIIKNQKRNYVLFGKSISISSNVGHYLLEIDESGAIINNEVIEFPTGGGIPDLLTHRDGYVFSCSAGLNQGSTFYRLDSTLTPVSTLMRAYYSSPFHSTLSWAPGAQCKNPVDNSIVQFAAVSDGGVRQFSAIKVDSNLHHQWIKKYQLDSLANYIVKHVLYTSDNSFLAIVDISMFNPFHTNFMTMKIDTSGNVLWAYNYGDTSSTLLENIFKSFEISDGYIHFGLNTYLNPHGSARFKLFMLKTDLNGQASCNQNSVTVNVSSIGIDSSSTTPVLRHDTITRTPTITSTNKILSENIDCIVLNTAEIKYQPLYFFPNPVNDQLHIRTNSNESFGIVLRDVSGHILLNQHASGNEITLPMNDYPSGIYFLHFKNASESKVEKIIVFH
jgi:hypothetical protein